MDIAVFVGFAASGPIANNIYYAVSGFYRYDNGPLVTGFPTEGYQLRGNFKRSFDSGEFKIYWQAINDKDIPEIQGVVLVVATAFVLINLVVDIIYAYLNPKIRLS